MKWGLRAEDDASPPGVPAADLPTVAEIIARAREKRRRLAEAIRGTNPEQQRAVLRDSE